MPAPRPRRARRRADAADPGGVRGKLEALQELVSGRATRRSRTCARLAARRCPSRAASSRRCATSRTRPAGAAPGVRGRAGVRAGEGIAAPAHPADRQEGAQRRGEPVGGRGREPRERHARPGDPQPQDRTGAAARAGEQLAHGHHPAPRHARGRLARHLRRRSHCPTASTGFRRAIREATHEPGAPVAAPALAVQPARGEGAAVDGGARRRRRGRQHRRHLPRRQRCQLGAVAGGHAGYFLVWRLCLYGATAYGWVWMRRRLLAREDQTRDRWAGAAPGCAARSPASSPSWRWKPAC
jgi:hypothetical protein